MKQRENFNSRLGFVLVSAGCAIGLGNVWKFPYICGQYGGATFIIIYLLFLVALGVPILCCEFAVGRRSGLGVARAYDKLEQKGTNWHKFKWIDIAGNFLLMMFYVMVGGWMLYYAYQYAVGGISSYGKKAIEEDYSSMLSSPGTLTIWMVIALVLASGICILGLEKGIEKITKVMMTLLIILIIVLAAHSLFLENAGEGLKFYLVPNIENIKKNGLGTVVFAAMTQAFFTLSVGMGSMEIFGSYINKKNTLLKETTVIVILDTFVALMAGLIIIPACFAYGVKPDAGPSLLFITLPNVFNHMPAGRIWGMAFFVFMSFAALSTIVAVVENIIAFWMDLLNWERKKAVGTTFVMLLFLSMPAILGYNVLSGIQLTGSGTSILDFEDFLVSNNVLPLGSLAFVLFCTRKHGWGFEGFIEETNTGIGMKFPSALRFYMTYILPVIIVGIYLKGYYDTFVGQGVKMLVIWMLVAMAFLGFVFYAIKRPKK